MKPNVIVILRTWLSKSMLHWYLKWRIGFLGKPNLDENEKIIGLGYADNFD